jgi:hypothetical protein
MISMPVVASEVSVGASSADGPMTQQNVWFKHRRLDVLITEDNSYVTSADFEATNDRQTQPTAETPTQ